jgi:hypothetical protein
MLLISFGTTQGLSSISIHRGGYAATTPEIWFDPFHCFVFFIKALNAVDLIAALNDHHIVTAANGPFAYYELDGT